MTVERDGYQSISDTIKLVAGTDRDFDFTLAKAAAGLEGAQAGVEAFNAGRFQDAAGQFEAAIAQSPSVPALHVNLAMAYLRLNRLPDAVASLEKAASLGSNDPAVQYQLGSAYVDMQEYDKAAAALEKGLAKAPDLGTDVLARQAASTLGAVYFAQGKVADAERQFQRVLAASAGDAGATLGMAKVHFSKGEVDQALKLFEQVAAQHPGTPEATQAATFIKELRKDPAEGGRP
ncbi:MAG: tetratricopeptide repeat protein [Vicinamibacterales bacterium]